MARSPTATWPTSAWRLLDDDPERGRSTRCSTRVRAGATAEQLARAVAYAAALRLVRFHTQNDHADWNTVHHAFTTANAVHQALVRHASPALLRGVLHGALRVYLDRFLNVPAARLPDGAAGAARRAGPVVGRAGRGQRGGGDRVRLPPRRRRPRRSSSRSSAPRCSREDVEFHWYQVFEAAVRQAEAWPDGSEEQALVLTGLARFLAAHTPTRRELSRVIDIATRLRRGEALYEDSSRPGDSQRVRVTAAVRRRSTRCRHDLHGEKCVRGAERVSTSAGVAALAKRKPR